MDKQRNSIKRGRGKPKIIKSPDELLNFFNEYKKYNIANPIHETIFVGKDAIERIKKHYKPLTWQGFEVFLFHQGIADNSNQSGYIDLKKYRTNFNNAYTEYVPILRVIGLEMFDQKYSGAAVGIYNANIIAKELGLADKSEITTQHRPILEQGRELPEDE